MMTLKLKQRLMQDRAVPEVLVRGPTATDDVSVEVRCIVPSSQASKQHNRGTHGGKSRAGLGCRKVTST